MDSTYLLHSDEYTILLPHPLYTESFSFTFLLSIRITYKFCFQKQIFSPMSVVFLTSQFCCQVDLARLSSIFIQKKDILADPLCPCIPIHFFLQIPEKHFGSYYRSSLVFQPREDNFIASPAGQASLQHLSSIYSKFLLLY